MIGVQVGSVRIKCDDNLRFVLADDLDQLPANFFWGHVSELLVAVSQQMHLGYAEHLAGCQKFSFSDLRKILLLADWRVAGLACLAKSGSG